MTAHDDLNREIRALRERISALGAASLRASPRSRNACSRRGTTA